MVMHENATFLPTDEICPEGKRKCLTSGHCVFESLWCDFIVDCPDGSDEVNCGKCLEYMYVCVCVFFLCIILFGWHTTLWSRAILDHVVVADWVWFPLTSLTVTKRMVLGIYRNTITPDNIVRPVYLLDVQQIVKCRYIPHGQLTCNHE